MRGAIIIGILATCSAGAWVATETTVTVSGQGAAPGLGPAARSSAIADAQATIVLDRLEKLAPTRNFAIFTPLLQSAPAFFQSFKLVHETKTEGSTGVEIEGQLLDRKLKNEIAAIVLGQDFVPPRIIILAREKLTPPASGDPSLPGIIEKELQEDLKRIQFDIVSSEVLRQKIPPEKWAECIDGNTEYPAMLGREMLADIVVLGSGATRIEEELPGANMHRVRADVAIRVVRAVDGYVIDAPKAEAVVNCIDPAEGSAQAIEDACGKLMDDAKTAVALGALSGTPDDTLLVTIEAPPGDARIDEAIAAIKRCLGVEKHEVLFQEGKRVRLRIEFAGPVGQLVDCLPTAKLSTGRLALKTVVNRDVTLSVDAR